MQKSPFAPWLWICAWLTLGILLTLRELSMLPDGKAHAYVLDIGQGDSILLVSPSGKQIVVDGGPDFSTLERLPEHMSFFDRSLDLLVLTHPNLDHLAAFPELLRRYTVKHVLITGVSFPLARYNELLDEIRKQNIPVILADSTKDIDLGDGLTLDTVWPRHPLLGQPTKDENNTSVGLRALTDTWSILLTGDMERKEEEWILKTGAAVRSTVLKAAHHGSKTSSSTGFLLAVRPEVAAISVGKDNTYGHPHHEVIERYRTMGISVRMTEDEGTIDF